MLTIIEEAGSAGDSGPCPQVELIGIAKNFGPVSALRDVSFSAAQGRVHALLGENGAGKTTLMRILYGLTAPDSGLVRVGGVPVSITSPRIARAHGIGMVNQHFALVGPMSVAENLLLTHVGNGIISLPRARSHVIELSETYGLDVEPDALVEDLPVGGRQRVEILKALSHGCSTLVLDEPTAVLAPADITSLFALIRQLCADRQLAVIFISHKMKEVLEISDEVSVLRQGTIVSSQANEDLDIHRLTRLMVGDDNRTLEVLTGAVSGEVNPGSEQTAAPHVAVLEVSDLVVTREGNNVVDRVTLTVHSGEIVGVAGVTGNGQTEMVAALLGVVEPTSGTIRMVGTDIIGTGVRGRRSAGLAGVSEDRHSQIVGALTVAENLALSDPGRLSTGHVLSRGAMTRAAGVSIDEFRIKGRANQAAGTLSGGNMQKVLLARMFAASPRVVVIAQPTRGLDVASTAQIRSELRERAAAGTGILLFSEDLDEVFALADRIVVLFRGRIIGEVAGATATAANVGRLMAGIS